jgi:hypothetical protein
MGLLVDKDKPGGSGTPSDRNTARKLFRNYPEYGRNTGVNENLIRRFYLILQSISSGYEMNTEKLNQYTKDTAKLFVNEHPWFYMTGSFH